MPFIFFWTVSFQLEPSIHLILQFSVIFLQVIPVILYFFRNTVYREFFVSGNLKFAENVVRKVC